MACDFMIESEKNGKRLYVKKKNIGSSCLHHFSFISSINVVELSVFSTPLQDVLAYLLQLPAAGAERRNFGAISAGAAISGHRFLGTEGKTMGKPWTHTDFFHGTAMERWKNDGKNKVIIPHISVWGFCFSSLTPGSSFSSSVAPRLN